MSELIYKRGSFYIDKESEDEAQATVDEVREFKKQYDAMTSQEKARLYYSLVQAARWRLIERVAMTKRPLILTTVFLNLPRRQGGVLTKIYMAAVPASATCPVDLPS
ncbi:MAG: hypothetical protein WCH04_17195 [Gammaproteobacteria bacterium]